MRSAGAPGTRDGLAIAQAVLEELHQSIRCRAIFATHFHELFMLSEALPRLQACTMRVKEWRAEVVFMHEVAPGAAQRSLGRACGATRRGSGICSKTRGVFIEGRRNAMAWRRPRCRCLRRWNQPRQAAAQGRLEAELAGLDLDKMTPREALVTLYELRAKLMAYQGKAG